jgi:hypothetical protein
LTLKQLQRITLESQGLLKTSPFGKGKKAVINALEHLGYLQIDTLSIIERAHHHTLWTRIPNYQTHYLDELVEERKIFEYWFHAASYLPMRDFRFVLPQMLNVKQSKTHYYNADPKVMQYVLDTIRTEGPKKARDFENKTKKSGSWWSWKPTKVALERLFLQGDLMVCGRNGMQKTYDISERVMPLHVNTTIPTDLEFVEYLVNTYLRAYGFTTIKQITHLKTGKLIRKNVDEVLNSMLQDGTIQQINIKNMPSVFMSSDLFEKPLSKMTSTVRLLSPFDNSIIHRDRIKQLFDFDYKIECYTPKEKRQYGYFCLPILFGDTFIGRVDCKAHRKEKQFEIINLYIENQNLDIELWGKPFVETIRKFATFNGCESLQLTKVKPLKLTNILKRLIKNNGK